MVVLDGMPENINERQLKGNAFAAKDREGAYCQLFSVLMSMTKR